MKSSTPFLKAFGPLLFGRKAAPQLPDGEELGELYDVFAALIPSNLFERPAKGVNSRKRALPPEVTFWAFLSQALSPGSSCREVVRKLEAWWHWSGLNRPSTVSESGYCQARKRANRLRGSLSAAIDIYGFKSNLHSARLRNHRSGVLLDG